MPTTPDNPFPSLQRIMGLNTYTHGEESIIAQSLQAGTLQGASDGSMAHNRATQAWRIEPLQNNCLSQHYTQGAGPVDGDPHTLDSTTAERGGFLGPLWSAYELARKYALDRGAITMHIDNISSYTAGDPPQKGEGPLRHLTDDYHLKLLKQECTKALQAHNIQIHWCHVKSHQDLPKNQQKDKKGKALPLTQPALLNIDCDRRAEAMYTHPDKKQRPTHTPLLPNMVKAYFISNGITNNKKLKTQITRDMHGPPLTEYILNKTGWTRQIFETVD